MKRKKYTTTLTIILTPQMYDTVKRVSDERGVSISELMRTIIEKFLNTRESEVQ